MSQGPGSKHSPEPPRGTPPADFEIDAGLVRGLLADQHPDLAELPLEPMDAGWDNAMFRLGSRLTVRLPRRRVAARLIEYEQRWLPTFAHRLPLPTPVPERLGRPGRGYPWRWSIAPWIPGAPADLEPPGPEQAPRLAAFLRALHVQTPPEAPEAKIRGVPLETRAEQLEARWARLEEKGGHRELLVGVRPLWDEALRAEIDTPATWLHGDLHARNVLVRDGELSGVIDWGDLARGDRATDLAALWMLLPTPAARRRAMAAYGGTHATWQRARGWAVYFGIVLLETGLVDHPRHAAMGELTLRRVLEGP